MDRPYQRLFLLLLLRVDGWLFFSKMVVPVDPLRLHCVALTLQLYNLTSYGYIHAGSLSFPS